MKQRIINEKKIYFDRNLRLDTLKLLIFYMLYKLHLCILNLSKTAK